MIRKQRSARVFAILAVFLLVSPLALGADWASWLGPSQNGESPEKDVFGKKKPKLDVAWTRPLGKAYSAIAVADGKAVTMFGDGETDWLIAMDAASGEDIWRYRVDAMFPKIGGADGGQLSMPVIAGGTVYALGAKGQLFAVSLKDGKEIWRVLVDEEYGGKQPHFGFTTTPLIVGDALFVQVGGDEGGSMVALDRKTGKKRWSHGKEGVGYQSPVFIELAGRKQIVAAANVSVVGLTESGETLWSIAHGVSEQDGWSTPLQLGDDTFLLTGRNESAAFRIKATDAGFAAEELWRGTNLKGNFAAPVVQGEHVYGYDGEFLACIEVATGEQVWKARSSAAGMVLVDRHLVIFDSEGNVVVGTASPKGFEEKGKIKVAEDGGYTYPSFSDGAVYVRNLETIARVNVH